MRSDYKSLLLTNILLTICIHSASSQLISNVNYSLHEILIWTSFFIFVLNIILIIEIFINMTRNNRIKLKGDIKLVVITILLIMYNIYMICRNINFEYLLTHIKIEI